MGLRHTIVAILFLACWNLAAEADPPYNRSGLGGGGHHALTGGGHHALGGGTYYHSGHHHHSHGHHHHHGHFHGGFFGSRFVSGSLYFSPGYFSYSAPGYSFFSGTTTVLPAPAWTSPTGGYMYGAPGYHLDPYGPAIGRPGFFDSVPADEQAQFEEWLGENRRAWEDPIEELPLEHRPERFIKPSSTEAQVRSLRLQHEGDLRLKNLQYGVAMSRYRDAIEAAPDRAEPYFRLAVASAAQSDFTGAVRQMKLGLQLAPDFPSRNPSLASLLGDENLLARTLIKQRVADWTREDIRDPDRLFLLGVLLHIDGDDRSEILFDSAARLGGMSFHLAAFLRGDEVLQRAERETDPAPVPTAEPDVEPVLPLPPLPAP